MDWKRAKETAARAEALTALRLSEKNRQLAERYLNAADREDEGLLKEAERQNFYELDQASVKKSMDYVEYCEEEKLTQELGRYIRFTAAVGGSTLCYILRTPYGILEWLSASLQAAVLAESAAWDEAQLNRKSLLLLFSICEKNPRALRKALGLCGRRGYNVQILLHGIYLYYVRPRDAMVGRYIRESEHAPELSAQLAKVLNGTLALLFKGGKPAGELERLQSFAMRSEPSEDFPEDLRSLLGVRKFSGYLLRLLGGSAYLSLEHSDRFLVFLRILTAMDLEAVLDACLEICGDSWFVHHLERLEEVLPVPMEDYVRWCAARRIGEALTRVSLRCPEAVKRAAVSLPAESYHYLLDWMKGENAALYRELNLASDGVLRIRQAGELAAHYPVGRSEAKRYLLGSTEAETIYPFVKEWRTMDQAVLGDYGSNRTEKLLRLRESRDAQMYRRAAVLEGLCLNGGYFYNCYMNGSAEEGLAAVLALFDAEKIKVKYQTELLEKICSIGYSAEERRAAAEACVQVLIRKKEMWSAWYVAGLKDGSVFFRCICIRVLGSFGDEYRSVLLSCAQDSSDPVRDVLAKVCTAHRDWEPQIRSMRNAPGERERLFARRVLQSWGLNAEEGGPEGSPDALVAALLGGGRRRKVEWALDSFSDVHKKDGAKAFGEELAALLLCYADRGEPGIIREAMQLSGMLQKEELAAAMKALLERWIAEDADPRRKWVLHAASVHGGEDIVPVFLDLIQELPKKNRKLLAADAVGALVWNGSFEALAFVDQTARKCRYHQVREAAAEAFSQAAAYRGVTQSELRDQMVPDLGFDGHGERIFDYGSRSFRAAVTSGLTLEILDENEKCLKNMPVPGKKDDPALAKAAYESLKQLKRQLKIVAENQKRRMERVYLNGRRWKVEAWISLFVKNPVMCPFASGLIWGSYEDGRLVHTFRYIENGSFQNAGGEPYELTEALSIGLVHPIELSEEQLSAWSGQLKENQVIQPVLQLERPFYARTEEEQELRELERFVGVRVDGRALSAGLLDQEWLRGPVGDGGIYDCFYRTDGNVRAELSVSGCHVSAACKEETELDAVCFYRRNPEMKKERGRPYLLGELPPGYLSEIILQLTRATTAIIPCANPHVQL